MNSMVDCAPTKSDSQGYNTDQMLIINIKDIIYVNILYNYSRNKNIKVFI